MIVPLIPLFFGVIIGVRERDWEYGSEAIYDVRIESVSFPFEQMDTVPTMFEEIDKLATFNMSMKLNCRPKSDSSLVCRFNESNLAMRSTKNEESFQFERLIDMGLFDETFELKFREDGLNEIIVSSSINLARLDVIRAIVAQLSIGANFYASNIDSEFTENFTTGTCQTRYDLSLRKAVVNCGEYNKPYETVKIPEIITTMGTIKEMERTRIIDKCHNRVDYFFGSRKAETSTPSSNIKIKLKSSLSKMIIEESNFTSWTENKFIASSELKSGGNLMIERIILNLENIVAASGPFPEIREPTIASIFPGAELHDDSSEDEKISSEEKSSSGKTNDFS